MSRILPNQMLPGDDKPMPRQNPDTQEVNRILKENGLEPTRQNRRRFQRQVLKDLKRFGVQGRGS